MTVPGLAAGVPWSCVLCSDPSEADGEKPSADVSPANRPRPIGPPVCALPLVQQISRIRAKPRPKSVFAFVADPTRIALPPLKTKYPAHKLTIRDATIERRLQGIFAGQIAPT